MRSVVEDGRRGRPKVSLDAYQTCRQCSADTQALPRCGGGGARSKERRVGFMGTANPFWRPPDALCGCWVANHPGSSGWIGQQCLALLGSTLANPTDWSRPRLDTGLQPLRLFLVFIFDQQIPSGQIRDYLCTKKHHKPQKREDVAQAGCERQPTPSFRFTGTSGHRMQSRRRMTRSSALSVAFYLTDVADNCRSGENHVEFGSNSAISA